MAAMRVSMSMEQASLFTSRTNRSLGLAITSFFWWSVALSQIVESKRGNKKKAVGTG